MGGWDTFFRIRTTRSISPPSATSLPSAFAGRAWAGTRSSGKSQEAVELFSLPDPCSPPALMSYGGRRRLQAAISYLLPREILVLDEIDSGLSCREVERLLDALIPRAPGIIFITHDMSLATSLSDRILVLEAGRLSRDFRPPHTGKRPHERGFFPPRAQLPSPFRSPGEASTACSPFHLLFPARSALAARAFRGGTRHS